MSTIAVDNARPSAGGTSYSLTDGVAKSWATSDMTGTASLLEEYNVSSLTDGGTGAPTYTFTNSFTTSNTAQHANDNSRSIVAASASSTSSATCTHFNIANAVTDYSYNDFSRYGDLA